MKERMSVAKRCKDTVKTEHQWNMAGFKIKVGAEGERMWSNQYCGHIYIYYRENEVEEMDQDEKSAWLENERLKRNELARESRKKRIREEKHWREQMQREKETKEREWQEWREAATTKIEELKTGPNRLAAVSIDGYGIYFYEVPIGIEPETQGMFPFGEWDKVMPGVIQWIVSNEDLEKIAEEMWFPYRLKCMVVEQE